MMKCTSCNAGELVPSFIDGLFRAHTCSNCQGNWILIEDYVAWKERNPEFTFDDNVNYEVEDTKKAILCPVTGTIMRKFRLTASNTYRIDYSAGVGGVWLDSGEWELLKEEGLAGSLNAVLTSHWQKNIRTISTKDNFYEIYLDKFGQETYEKVKELRTWLEKQPNKADLRAYLLAEDPYSAEK
ncbi:zf-TFIIB domain-containing protein [Thalassomonas actiniarum]|nr:zf-TFIIB domain-containing protein [Thalassomonas actiniarum]